MSSKAHVFPIRGRICFTDKSHLACSRPSDSRERCEVKKEMKSRGGTGESGAGRLLEFLTKMCSGIPDPGIPFDRMCQHQSVFDLRAKWDMAVMRGALSRHTAFKFAINTVLSDFPNVEAIHKEQRNCLKHLVDRIDVFAILLTGFGKSLIFQLFPQIKRALERRQEGMPFTIVVVTPLIAIMKDQVQHLNKIGVAGAMIGEYMDEAVKSGSCEIIYRSPESWLS